MKKTAVVLMNLGGPNSLEEVRPFLRSLFSDPAILTLPQPLRWGAAQFISSRRVLEATKIYTQIGGKSPLLENTQAQAGALESQLGEEYKVFIAMRHATPRTEQAVREVEMYDPDEVVLLPLYPQFSTTTTASSFKEWHRLFKSEVPVREVCCYPTLWGFVKGYAEFITDAYEKALPFGSPRVLLTAHGLPEKIIKRGDPYQFQVEQSAAAIVRECAIPEMDAVVCYQSRVGPMTWIGPYADEEIKKASLEKRPLVVAPISFVSEHSETLVELDIEYRELAEEMGCPAYMRVQALGCHPLYMQALAQMVKEPHCHQRVCAPSCRLCYFAEKDVKENEIA